MTSEPEFQAMIDKNNDDFQTRSIFADWLEDHDDPRAAGYRAIAVNCRKPLKGSRVKIENGKAIEGEKMDTWRWCSENKAVTGIYNHIPKDWFNCLPDVDKSADKAFWPAHKETTGHATRQECEDALALAFNGLSPERQKEILAGDLFKS